MVEDGDCCICGVYCGNWVNYHKGEVYHLCKKHFDLWFDFLAEKIKRNNNAWENDKSSHHTTIKNQYFKEYLKLKPERFVFR
jgi:hypothetical protein